MSDQIDIDEVCGDRAANVQAPGTRHRRRIANVLRHFAAAQVPLATICDDRHMMLAPETVRRYCRKFGISLVDYTPRALKTKPDAG
jgi:hypothetical protein